MGARGLTKDMILNTKGPNFIIQIIWGGWILIVMGTCFPIVYLSEFYFCKHFLETLNLDFQAATPEWQCNWSWWGRSPTTCSGPTFRQVCSSSSAGSRSSFRLITCPEEWRWAWRRSWRWPPCSGPSQRRRRGSPTARSLTSGKRRLKADSHELHLTWVAAADGCVAAAEIGIFLFFPSTHLPQPHTSNAACLNQP